MNKQRFFKISMLICIMSLFTLQNCKACDCEATQTSIFSECGGETVVFGPNLTLFGTRLPLEDPNTPLYETCRQLHESFTTSSLMPLNPGGQTVWIYQELGRDGTHRTPKEAGNGALWALRQHNTTLQQQTINWIARYRITANDPLINGLPTSLRERIEVSQR